MSKRKLDSDKFDRLVHYIIWKCPDMDKLGSVKLQKILWKADTAHYIQRGEPITGARYVKRQYGPATNELLQSRDRLKASMKIDYWRDNSFADGYSKYIYKPLERPTSGLLTEDEAQIVDFWINEICLKHTANSISDDTHGYAWDIAAIGEEMPMESALVERGREPEGKELERAQKRAKELGLI